MEIWKPIKNFEGLYEISNMGEVRNESGHILKAFPNHKGYLFVKLTKNKKSKPYRIHRLVAEAYVPNLRNCECVNHIDECKTNNRYDNLEWVTVKENNNHGTKGERTSRGLKYYYANHTESTAHKVRCVETGDEYFSIREAVRQTRGDYKGIRFCLKGKRHTSGGYHWEYVESSDGAQDTM